MFRVTGGEPTLSPQFDKIMQMLDEQGKPIVVFTNGAWEDPNAVIEILRACNNLDGILVSLHGYSPSSYRAFTRTDCFEKVLENITRASKAGIVVNTNAILTHQNINNVADVVNVAIRAGAEVVAFSRYYGVPIPGLTDLAPEQYIYAVDQVSRFRAMGKKVKFNNNIPLCLGGQLTQACPAGDTHCTISPAGMVRLCNHLPEEIGNILVSPIEQIWQSTDVQKWRLAVPSMCQHCAVFDLCKGGCRAHARANGLEMDPLACGPLRTVPKPSTITQHMLCENFSPRVNFALHEERFGYVLINRSQIIKVTDEAKPLIDVLQRGDSTLEEIHTRFGQEILNFVGVLFDNRMIELKR